MKISKSTDRVSQFAEKNLKNKKEFGEDAGLDLNAIWMTWQGRQQMTQASLSYLYQKKQRIL